MYQSNHDFWDKEFSTNPVRFIGPDDLDDSVPELPSLTYRGAAQQLITASKLKNLDLSDYDYEFGEVSPQMGPVTTQCCFTSHMSNKHYFSGVYLWVAPKGDIRVVITELQELAK